MVYVASNLHPIANILRHILVECPSYDDDRPDFKPHESLFEMATQIVCKFVTFLNSTGFTTSK